MSETDPTGVPADGTARTPNGADPDFVEDGSYIDSELENDVAAPDSDDEGEYTDSDLK